MRGTMIKLDAGMEAERIVTQIDAIIPERLALRRRLSASTPTASESGHLADALYGVLGHGSWDEYDADLDWLRFGA